VTDNLKIGDDIYQFLDNIELNKINVQELIEYVHYKSLLNSFTFIIENNKDLDLSFLLTDYVEIISQMQTIYKKIKEKYEKI